MKKAQWLSGMLLSLLFSGACSHKVYVQKDNTVDFSKLKTYRWVAAQKDSLGHTSPVNKPADNEIRKSIDNNLSAGGWKQVKRHPDVLLIYEVAVQKESRHVSDPVYSQPLDRWYYNPYRGGYVAMNYPTELMGFTNQTETITEGTLTLTIMKASTGKIIWQGWTSSEMNGRRMTDKEIDANVKAIIRKLQ